MGLLMSRRFDYHIACMYLVWCWGVSTDALIMLMKCAYHTTRLHRLTIEYFLFSIYPMFVRYMLKWSFKAIVINDSFFKIVQKCFYRFPTSLCPCGNCLKLKRRFCNAVSFKFTKMTYSSGALVKKNHANLEKCSKLKFSGKLLGCPLNTLVKSPQNPSWGIFLFKMAAITTSCLLVCPKIM